MAIKVQATLKGYYGNAIRNEDDVFFVNEQKEVGSWMLVLQENAEEPAEDAAVDAPLQGKKKSAQ